LPTEDEISGVQPHQRPPRPSPTKIGNHKLKAQTLMLGYGFISKASPASGRAGRRG
jgi:methionine-gamma-lyase